MTTSTEARPAAPSTAALVSRYASAFNAPFLGTRHGVASPLGAWLLLALAGPTTHDHLRVRLEDVLGTGVDDARARAERLLADPHPAVGAAVAAWADQTRLLPAYTGFADTLPADVEKGPVPDQAAADAWASDHTRGLVKTFPLTLTPSTLLVLASALVTDISWIEPLTRRPAADLGGEFAGQITQTLYHEDGFIADTEAAGLVAVTVPETSSGLDVHSVIAAPDVLPHHVHDAAHQVAAMVATERAGSPGPGAEPEARRVDLFDLELGEGAAWTIVEDVVRSQSSGPEQRCVAWLPAWDAESEHDLAAAPGVPEVRAALSEFVRPEDQPAGFQAKQTAVASFTATGFKAAAVTAFAVTASAAFRELQSVTRRTAEIRFNRPYAVLAVATRADDSSAGEAWEGVPVFSAWVEKPTDAT